MSKVTFVVDFEDGKEPVVHAGMTIFGVSLVGVSWRDWRDALEAAEALNTELTEALRQSVNGYKSCLRMGHDRILDVGGGCEAPEVMIAAAPKV